MTSSRKFDACSCSSTTPLSWIRLSTVLLDDSRNRWLSVHSIAYFSPTLCKCCPIRRSTSFWLVVKILEWFRLPLLNGYDEPVIIVWVEDERSRWRGWAVDPFDDDASCPLLLDGVILLFEDGEVMVAEVTPLACWVDRCFNRSELFVSIGSVDEDGVAELPGVADSVGEVLACSCCSPEQDGDCMDEWKVESFARVDVDRGFKRARLGGGHPATSSSELDEASIARRVTKNDSYGNSS